MSKVHVLLDVTTVSTETAGDAVHPQHRLDETGAVQYRITAGTCTEIELQGRMAPDMSWIQVATSGALNAAGALDDREVLQTGVAVLPFMRAVIKGPSSASAIVAFME